MAVYEGTVVISAQDENGAKILDKDGSEVTYTVSRGTAEITVSGGIVTEARTGELTDEDLAPFFDGGPDGPGRIYEILRARLPSLVKSTPPPPEFFAPPPDNGDSGEDTSGYDTSDGYDASDLSDAPEPPFDLTLADIQRAAEDAGYAVGCEGASALLAVPAETVGAIVVEYERKYPSGSLYSQNTVFEFRSKADADRVADSMRDEYIAVQNGRFLALIYYVEGFTDPERMNDQIEAFTLLLGLDPGDAGIPHIT